MDWITRVMESLGYWGIVAIVALENLFPPIPSELVLPFAGFLTTTGPMNAPGVVLAATLGSVLGALALYTVGAIVGRERVYFIVRRYGRFLTVREDHVERAEDWFDRYGRWTVFFARMVPILRSIISIPAGLTRMPLLPFIAYTIAGTLIWNVLLVGAGVILGAAWPEIVRWIDYYQNLVIVAGVAVVAYWLWLQIRPRLG